MPAGEQLAILIASMEGLLDGMDEVRAMQAMAAIRRAVREDDAGLAASLTADEALTDELRAGVTARARQAVEAMGKGDDADA